jgi:DNA-binding XRE family transcriptional regulator
MIMATVCRGSELALQAQVSAQTLAKIEHGHSTDPGFTVVAVIVTSLGLRLDDLVKTRAGGHGRAAGVVPTVPATALIRKLAGTGLAAKRA